MTSVVESGSAVDREDLARLLGRPVTRIRPVGSREWSTHPLERVVVETGGAPPLELVLKGTRATRRRGRHVRPRLVRDEGREAWAYARLLDPIEVHSPEFHGLLHPGSDRERLVLEATGGHPLTEVGDRGAWVEAARTLAKFHRWGVSRAARVSDDTRLLRQSTDLHRRWWERAVRRASALGERDAAARLRALRESHLAAVDHLARTTSGLVHGEFYPSNMMVQRRASAWRVRPLDWESVGVGPVLLDLAALTTGDWAAEERSELIDAYLAVNPLGGEAAVYIGLSAARLVNATQWLGWSVHWKPPREHARNWLAEAEDAAAHL